MSGWAKPGAKCQCIDHRWHTPPTPGTTDPEIGEILTVREVATHPHFPASIGVSFVEKSPDDFWGIRNFRPLISKTQAEDVRMVKSLVREMPASERLDRLVELLNEPETP